MAETFGTMQMRGESDKAVHVRINTSEGRLRLVAGEETVGEWDIDGIGIHSVPEGFLIRAEGEEFLLRSEDEAVLAEEFGMAATTPRLARKVAASHNPPVPEEVPPPPLEASRVGPIALALGGALVLIGGTLLRPSSGGAAESLQVGGLGGIDFWLAFLIGGLLMVAVGYVLSLGRRWARVVAMVVLAGLIGLFAYSLSLGDVDAGQLTAYGFIAGGVVVSVAVLFGGSAGGLE